MSVKSLIYRWFRYEHSLSHRTMLLNVVRVAISPTSSAALCLIIDSSFDFVDLRWCRFDPYSCSLTTTLNHVTMQDEISHDASLLPPEDVVNYYIRKHSVCA